MGYAQNILSIRKEKHRGLFSPANGWSGKQQKAGVSRALRLGTATLLIGGLLFGASLMFREDVPGKEKEVRW